ncbi:MAG: hypothetical protein IJF54_06755 [Clostridia bacterium]|nr:hypothetical protein [Clostridia bacterium]
MFIKMPKGIKNSDELVEKLLKKVSSIDRRLLVTDKNQDTIKIVLDSVNRLSLTVYDGAIIITCAKVVRKFYAFDYDTALEWVDDAAQYLSKIINSTVKIVNYYNRRKKCVKQELYKLSDEHWVLIIAIPKTINLFAANSKKLQAVSDIVTFTQQ